MCAIVKDIKVERKAPAIQTGGASYGLRSRTFAVPISTILPIGGNEKVPVEATSQHHEVRRIGPMTTYNLRKLKQTPPALNA
jgi:hypothetical protein